MPRQSDVAFTFDPSQILQGVRRINQSMSGMTRQITRGAQNMAKSVRQGVLRAAAVFGLLTAGFRALRNAIQRMPEVGQAFGIAREIIMKNLLWPLRKELMPLLQRMLDWVKENRARFVAWGQVVANVFRVIVEFVRKAIDFVKQLFERIQVLFKSIFGDGTQELADLMNLLLAKFAVIAEFVGGMLSGLVDWLVAIIERYGPGVIQQFREVIGFLVRIVQEYGPMLLDLFNNLFLKSGVIGAAWELIQQVFETVVQIAGELLRGFNENSLAIGKNIRDIINHVRELVKAWTDPNADGYSLLTLARTIGEYFGQILEHATSLIEAFTGPFFNALHNAMTPLNQIVEAFQKIFNLIYEGEGLQHFFSMLGEWLGTAVQKSLELIADVLTVIAGLVEIIRRFFDEQWPAIQEKLGIGQTTETQGRIRELFTEWMARPGGILGKAVEELANFFRGRQVDDAIITKRGEVIQFNPADTIIATRNPGGLTGGVAINIPGMVLQVTQGNAESAGRAFALGLGDQIRLQLNSDIERLGIR